MATATGKICLELRHVGIDFRERHVLKDLSLAIEEQEIVSVIGPNGAGKTTLFNIICGRIRPTRGVVLFRGRDITRWAPHRICHAGIARTFQIARPFPEMSVLENILIGLWFGKKSDGLQSKKRDEAFELLETMGLTHKQDLPAGELTLSEMRRLEVARALATKPQLLLLDEIAAGLSPQAVKQLVELVKRLRSGGLTFLIIDHFLTLTAKVSDRLIVLEQGEKIIEGNPCEVLECPEVISAYLGDHSQSGQEEDSHEA